MFLNLDNPIAERNTKTVYRDGNKTIKLFVPHYPKSNILNEALNLARIEEGTDLNVPKLVEISKIDDRWALVLEYVEGTPLNVLMNEHPENMDKYLDLFVNVQTNILSKNVPMLNKMKEKFHRKISGAKNISDDIKYELLQRLDSMKGLRQVCHGDFNPSNVIVTNDNNTYVIDWSHVTQGNAPADAARTFLLFSMEGKDDLAKQYLTLFSEKTGIEISTIQSWIPIVAASQMTKEKPEEQEFLSKWINVVDF